MIRWKARNSLECLESSLPSCLPPDCWDCQDKVYVSFVKRVTSDLSLYDFREVFEYSGEIVSDVLVDILEV